MPFHREFLASMLIKLKHAELVTGAVHIVQVQLPR
jgi:hypothetical protein